MKKVLFFMLLVFTFSNTSFTQPLSYILPEKVGMSSAKLAMIEKIARKAIEEKNVPGINILVARKGKIVYKKAFGYASLEPVKTNLTTDMVYDLASITKPVATATSIMILVEQGKLRLVDEVRRYLPEFSPYIDENGKEHHSKIYHLLTHTSGMPDYSNPDSLERVFGSYCPDSITKHLCRIKKKNLPGEVFEYTCLGFIALAKIIQKISGKPLDEFACENIFKPLKMNYTSYNPKGKILKLCVPTERFRGNILCGIVHDQVAMMQGGVSGNAGLFSNLDDLAIFSQMMLNGGEYNGIRILSPLTVKLMTNIYPKTPKAKRGLGWDVDSDYMGQRGDIIQSGSFGHTGFTGTSINIDKGTQTILIVLTNSVHPNGKGRTLDVRKSIANIVAASIENE